MRDINTLIRKKILGIISEEEDSCLQRWLTESSEHRNDYDRIMHASDLEKRYREYAGIDEQAAWKQFKKSHINKRHINGERPLWIRSVLRYAAVLLLPVMILVSLYYVSTIQEKWQAGNQRELPSFSRSSRRQLASGAHKSATPAKSGGPAMWLAHVKPVTLSTEDSAAAAVSGCMIAETKASSDKDEKWVTLEDGTVVHLNHSSSLVYPEHFEDDNRTVRLEGEAYFVVAKDRQRPFYVLTSSGIVKEYGTSFNVNTYTPGFTKVVLVEGSVGLKSNQGGETMLKPGELAVMSGSSSKVEISKVDVMPYVAWNNGRYVFMDTSLEQLMNVIGYWYGLNIHFEAHTDRDKRFTGDIDQRQNLSTLLNALRRATDLRMTIQNGRDLVIENN